MLTIVYNLICYPPNLLISPILLFDQLLWNEYFLIASESFRKKENLIF